MKKHHILLALIFIAVMFMSMGYASINSVSLGIEGEVLSQFHLFVFLKVQVRS